MLSVNYDAQLVCIAEIQQQPYRTVLVPQVSEPKLWTVEPFQKSTGSNCSSGALKAQSDVV